MLLNYNFFWYVFSRKDNTLSDYTQSFKNGMDKECICKWIRKISFDCNCFLFLKAYFLYLESLTLLCYSKLFCLLKMENSLLNGKTFNRRHITLASFLPIKYYLTFSAVHWVEVNLQVTSPWFSQREELKAYKRSSYTLWNA